MNRVKALPQLREKTPLTNPDVALHSSCLQHLCLLNLPAAPSTRAVLTESFPYRYQ